MFVHNLKYTFKILFRNKALVFWTFAFPIILATFFQMAFSNLTDSEKLSLIKIAIVDNQDFQENSVVKTSFEKLSDPGNPDRLFETTYATWDDAQKLLESQTIAGVLQLENDEPKLTFEANGIDQTILKFATEEILQTSKIYQNLAEAEVAKMLASGNYQINYDKIYQKVTELTNVEDVELVNVANSNLDYAMIEFYTLIAMACMYGGTLGMVAINQSLANMSNQGKRITVAPTKKSVTITSSLLASYGVQLIGLALLFAYLIFVLQIDFGNNMWLVVVLALIGSLAGLALGMGVGVIFKTNENLKITILISVTMFGCFLAGMFGISTKYLVDKNFAIINRVNPVNMITDGFYALYYYDTLDRYWLNVISLVVFSTVLVLLSVMFLRKQKYDNL